MWCCQYVFDEIPISEKPPHNLVMNQHGISQHESESGAIR
jgi:hypothetical protein